MKSESTSTTSVQHYSDWPNAVGFDAAYEEHEPVELQVQGHIPAYAAGTLFRTGIGPRSVNINEGKSIFKTNHWFDAFSQVHRFQLHAPSSTSPEAGIEKVTYNSRLTSDALIEEIQKTGKMDDFTFAANYEPCKSFFQKVQSLFTRDPPPKKPNEVNNAVTLTVNYPGFSSTGTSNRNPIDPTTMSTLCNKTDATRLQFLDPVTLKPTGLTAQDTLDPQLKGPFSAAHPSTDLNTGDTFNYNMDCSGRLATYRVFRTSASTGQTDILATINYPGAYLHSLFLTENFVILAVWNSHFTKSGASILWHRNLLDAMYFNTSPATWFIIDRRASNRGIIAQYTSPPFFAFHTINAYETPNPNKPDTVDITCDVIVYEDTSVIHQFYMDNLVSTSSRAMKTTTDLKTGKLDSARPLLRRYILPKVPLQPPSKKNEIVKGEVTTAFTAPASHSVELPTFNGSYAMKPYRYIYGARMLQGGKSTFIDSLLKYDLETKEVKIWECEGHTPGEAIFVANPDGKAEDEGVLLSVVLDGFEGKSYLLCLDARDLSELGRVSVNGPVGFGFHGTFTSRL